MVSNRYHARSGGSGFTGRFRRSSAINNIALRFLSRTGLVKTLPRNEQVEQ
jgi:hypothetical protein